jgi:hypothetical protein
MKLKPKVYRDDVGNGLPWVFRSGIEFFTFTSWESAMRFACWYCAEPTA